MAAPESLEFVIPIFNEAECVEALVARLAAVREGLRDLEVSFLFINDGSYDDTWEKLCALAERHRGLRLLDLSRNFGHQVALSAGLDHADADWLAIIDGDLQDPPELVPQMLAKAREGFDIVYGQRESRRGETWFKRLTAYAFYRLIQRLCGVPIPADTGDFRLMSRKVLRALCSMPERHRFIRGMVPWLGFKSAPVKYARDERYAGSTKYPFMKMLTFALDAIFSFSRAPLRLASLLGLLIILLSGAGGAVMVYLKLFTHRVVPGLTAILVSGTLLSGIQILMLGVMGEYVGRIFEEVKRRPLYVINRSKNVAAVARDSAKLEVA